MKSSKFLWILTLADIIPVLEKEDKEFKNNYRPVVFTLEKCKRALDNGNVFGILFTDLSKALESLFMNPCSLDCMLMVLVYQHQDACTIT